MMTRIARRSPSALLIILAAAAVLAPSPGFAEELSDDAFLDMIQRPAFGYFWHECGTNGLIQDRASDPQLSSTMAAGFQLTSLCIAAERGWITRQEAAERVRLILKTYERLPRFHGMFAHYYNIETGEVIPLMHATDDGADVSETGFMIAGVLMCRNFFDRDEPIEREIRVLATTLYETVEWDWMLQDKHGKTHRSLSWHWSPQHGFDIGQRVRSNMELSSLITYLLAIGSPTHPIPAECWNDGWAVDYPWWDKGIHPFVSCPPLFAHQYAQSWIDFRNTRDRHIDYFRNSTYATLANRAYCLEHLYPDHDIWGLTYCDGPSAYGIYGYPPKRGKIDEDATIPITGPAGSIVFTPSESISALRYIYSNYKDKLWGDYGLYDGFSLKHNWFFEDYVAIDQGPIVMMIENYRSGMVWKYFMRDENIRRAMDAVGFVGVVDDFELAPAVAPYNLWEHSQHYSHLLSAHDPREGLRALHVSYSKAGDPDAALTAHPALEDFSRYRYLSLWLRDLDALAVKIEDAARKQAVLPETGRLPFADGWTHIFFELPGADTVDLSRIQKVHFIAQPGSTKDKGSFFLDAVFLANKLDLHKPSPVQGIRTVTTRMPGEVILSWNPSGDDGAEGVPYQYLLRQSRRAIRGLRGFDAAEPIPTDPRARITGSTTNVHLTGLRPGATYHFAMRAEDLAGNISDLSNPATISLPSTRVPSEFTLDDFDAPRNTKPQVLWKASAPALTVEPVSELSLQGQRALKITYHKKGDKDAWAHVIAELDIRDLSQHRYLTMWVYGQAEILAKLWQSEDKQQDVSTETSPLAGGWSPLYFDLSAIEGFDRSSVSKILLFVQPGKTDCRGSLYIDSVRLTRDRD